MSWGITPQANLEVNVEKLVVYVGVYYIILFASVFRLSLVKDIFFLFSSTPSGTDMRAC